MHVFITKTVSVCVCVCVCVNPQCVRVQAQTGPVSNIFLSMPPGEQTHFSIQTVLTWCSSFCSFVSVCQVDARTATRCEQRWSVVVVLREVVMEEANGTLTGPVSTINTTGFFLCSARGPVHLHIISQALQSHLVPATVAQVAEYIYLYI